MRSVNSILTNYKTAKKQAEQAEKQAAAEAAAAEAAAKKAKERAMRQRAIKKFPTMSGVLLITVGHETWGLDHHSKKAYSIAVTLYNGNVTAATPIFFFQDKYRSGNRGYGDCSDTRTKLQYAALHTPKAAAVYERRTRRSSDYEQHKYTIGTHEVAYEDMKDKVEEILEHPFAIAAIEAAKTKAV